MKKSWIWTHLRHRFDNYPWQILTFKNNFRVVRIVQGQNSFMCGLVFKVKVQISREHKDWFSRSISMQSRGHWRGHFWRHFSKVFGFGSALDDQWVKTNFSKVTIYPSEILARASTNFFSGTFHFLKFWDLFSKLALFWQSSKKRPKEDTLSLFQANCVSKQLREMEPD